jgi:hypothetical protein
MTHDEQEPGAAGSPGGAEPRRRGRQVAADARRDRVALRALLAEVVPDKQLPGGALMRDDTYSALGPDLQLVTALRAELAAGDCTGPIWSEVSDRLVRFGLGVINAMVRSGQIYDRATRLGRPATPARPPFTTDECNSLVYDVVEHGVKLFRQTGIEAGDWDPNRGTRLSTYYVNSCVLCFANLCRKQVTARKKTNQNLYDADTALFDECWSAPSAERSALGKLALRSVLHDGVPDDVLQLVVTYSVFGYAPTEIAEMISTEHAAYQPHQVRRMLREYRNNVDKDLLEGDRNG